MDPRYKGVMNCPVFLTLTEERQVKIEQRRIEGVMEEMKRGGTERLVIVREPHHMRFMNFPVFLTVTERKMKMN